MTMVRLVTLASLLAAGSIAVATAADLDPKYTVGAKRSGYTFAEPETRAMQDDDFENPGFLWVQKGEVLWSKADGDEGKSCASCHKDAATSMKGVATHYPKVKDGKLINLEMQINNCREAAMKAKPWKYESEDLLSLLTYVRTQSRWMPVDVAIDGAAAPFFEKGKAEFYKRRGLLDMACTHCHEDNATRHLRSELLSQGQGNGFPTYRLKWQKLGSLQKRLQGCNEEIRAEPLPLGSEEYTALELYVNWRANGLPVETPAVRK